MTPHAETPAVQKLPVPLEVLAGVALAGSVLVLLALPSVVFPAAVSWVVLATVTGYVAIRIALIRCARDGNTGNVQEWLQLVALLLILLSLMPLPLALTRSHGYTRYEQNERVAIAIQRSTQLGLTTDSIRYGDGYAFTRNKAGSIRVLFALLLMHSAFLTARRISPQGRELQLWLLVMAGTLIAAAGLLSRYVWPQGFTLWWTFPTPSAGLPGPIAGFINPNHFAAFLALLAPCALALSIGSFMRRRWLSGLFALLLLAALAAGLLASHSRGGLLAFAVGIAAVGAVCLLRGRLLLGLFVAAIVLILALSLPVVISDAYRGRLQELLDLKHDDSYRTRMQAWADSRHILNQYPLFGAGANAFRMVYPQIRSDSTQARMTHAENEYVQLLSDFGIVGALLFSAILVSLLRGLGARVFARKHAIEATSLASAGVLCVVAAHAMVDFALHLPVYALTAATLVGLGCPPPSAHHRDTRRHSALAACVTVFMLGLVSVATWGRTQHIDSGQHINRATYDKLCRALRWAPTSPQAWRRMGSLSLKEKTLDARLFGEACLTQAGNYDPKDYTLWYEIGLARLELGDRQGARQAQRRVQSLKDWVWPDDIEMY